MRVSDLSICNDDIHINVLKCNNGMLSFILSLMSTGMKPFFTIPDSLYRKVRDVH